MKYFIKTTVIIGFFLFSNIYPCPTCVGTVHNNTAPFFSDEFYESAVSAVIDSSEIDMIITGSVK